MLLSNKFAAGDLIYVPTGTTLYINASGNEQFYAPMKTWYPTLAVYIGKKNNNGYYCVDVEGSNYWVLPEDLENLNFAR